MNVTDTIRTMLLEYPQLHLNALDAYNHLFCAYGNGYEWVNGELVDIYKKYPKNGLNQSQAAKIIFNRELSHRGLDVANSNSLSWLKVFTYMNPEKMELPKEEYANWGVYVVLEKSLEELLSQMLLNIDIDKRMKDFSPYVIGGKYKKYKIPLHQSKVKMSESYDKEEQRKRNCLSWWVHQVSETYSYCCNIPEDVKPDWLIAIDKMLWFIDTHSELWDPVWGGGEEKRLSVLFKGCCRVKEIVESWMRDQDKTYFNTWKKRDKKTSYLYSCLSRDQKEKSNEI